MLVFIRMLSLLAIGVEISHSEMLAMSPVNADRCGGVYNAKGGISDTESINLGNTYGLGTQNTRSVLECSSLCSAHDNCTEAFYAENTKECILTTDVRAHGTESIPANQRNGPFQKISWNKRWASKCSGSCPEGTTCMKDCIQDQAVCAAPISDCSGYPVANIQQFTSAPFETSQNNGDIQGVTYTKKHDYTYLRVHFRSNSRGVYNQVAYCVRWRFLFNGNECSNPNKINSNIYHDRNRNEIRNFELSGICYDSYGAGDMNIKVRTGSCDNGHHHGNAYTGWRTDSTMIIEEVDMRYNSGTCPGLSVFNIGQETWFGLNTGQSNGVITTYNTYEKRLSDTALRVYYYGDMRIAGASNNCGRYHILLNGAECANPGPIDSDFYFSDPDNNHRGTLFGGICEGIPAGTVNIQLATGACGVAGIGQGSMYSCWTSVCSIMVEEIRLEQDTYGLVSNSGTITYLPVFNIKYWSWEGSDSGVWATDNGVIQAVTYTKKSAASALRVQWLSTLKNGSHNSCIMWYFTFNGYECSNPNKIETWLYYQNDVSSNVEHHRAGTVEGICRGFPAGNVEIAFNVKVAPVLECGSGVGNAHTAWNSRAYLIVEEVHLGAYNDY